MVSFSNPSVIIAQKKGALALIFALIATALFAQPAVPENLNMEPLRDWLQVNWYQPFFDDLGYNGARTEMFGYTDEENNAIHGIYTGFEQESSYTTYLDPINTEHIVPQSFFGSLSPMKSDLFNIRPTHGNANSARGNSPYGEVVDENAQWYGIDGNGNYVTQGDIPSNMELWTERSSNLWEPRDDAKGDIARLVFYFYTMYPTEAGDMANIGDIETLYTWHQEDPVSPFESTRNERVQEVQGNANPYISHPDLVMRAWFWTGTTVPGCMDETACNYNLDATSDDGSCVYAEAGLDCDGNTLSSCSLYFSEYGEGSSNNKYLEIYNPGIESISLDGFALAHTVNAPSVPGSMKHGWNFLSMESLSRKAFTSLSTVKLKLDCSTSLTFHTEIYPMVTMVSPWSMVLRPTLPFSMPWEIGMETLVRDGMSQERAAPQPTTPSFANRLYQQAIPEIGAPLLAPLKTTVSGSFWKSTTGTTWGHMRQTKFATLLPMRPTTC